jgi:chromosome segregation ATPase
MKKKIVLVVCIVGLLWSCDLKKRDALNSIVDSLRNELQASHKLNETIVEIGTLLDSIDVNRKALRNDMMEGTTSDNFAKRMKDINQYVKKTEMKIESLEKENETSRSNHTAFSSALKKLKGDLEIRNHELAALQEQVATYKNENENLISTVSLQKAEIDDKLNQIKSKQNEAAQLQDQVNQLMIKSSNDTGEAYFERALAIEETAKRTKFAPRKKRNSNKQALELYKLALTFGKEEAQARIASLEKKL